LPAEGVRDRLLVDGNFKSDGDFMRLFVDGDFAKAGIEVVFKFLTLCERAMEDLVGVINRAARRGSAVWEVILRAGVAAAGVGASGLLSRDTGRVVAASSASVRLTRFAVGLRSPSPSREVGRPSRVGGTIRTLE
jgi:hypothetical protein